jgi:hypothetical protein
LSNNKYIIKIVVLIMEIDYKYFYIELEGFMGSVSPIQPKPNEVYQAKKDPKLVFDLAMQVIVAFFRRLQESRDKDDGDTSSKEGKIRHIQKLLEEGVISIQQAASAILSITQEEDHLTSMSLGLKQTESPQTLAVEHTCLFQTVVAMDPQDSANPLTQEVGNLLDRIQSQNMTPSEGIKQLNTLITAYNRPLPPDQHYPSLPPNLFL